MFLHLCVILFTGVCPPPWMQTPPDADPSGLESPPPPMQTPSPLHADPSPRYSQQTGGTHPTGMHTCINILFKHCGVKCPNTPREH